MPIRAVRCTSSRVLWEAFADSFLADNAGASGPGGFTSFAWLTHRIQRDALYRTAAARASAPGPAPAAFFSISRLFDIRQRSVGRAVSTSSTTSPPCTRENPRGARHGPARASGAPMTT
jgi:hypothetical protein